MLKVGSPQPQEPMPMADMGNDASVGGEMGMDSSSPMGDEMDMGDESMPPMDNAGIDMPDGDETNPFDSNFDAGIDADEENDPEKYIQQLTGKLSQSLNKYNENLPQVDRDLNKYVAGMILKQTTKGLSPDDVEEVMNKMKGDDNETNECVKRRKQQIDEIFQDVLDSDSDEPQSMPNRKVGFRKKPFSAPTFD